MNPGAVGSNPAADTISLFPLQRFARFRPSAGARRGAYASDFRVSHKAANAVTAVPSKAPARMSVVQWRSAITRPPASTPAAAKAAAPILRSSTVKAMAVAVARSVATYLTARATNAGRPAPASAPAKK